MGKEVHAMMTAIKVLLGVVLLGWLLLWIMRPTKAYKEQWSPSLKAKTDSTYFGAQGTNLLIYTFPVIFLSVVGCVYLHLEKKRDSMDTKGGGTKRSSTLPAYGKRPFLFRGPLGIVSAVEVSFFLMFVALVVWTFAMYLQVGLTPNNKVTAKNIGQELWEFNLMIVAHRLAHIGNMCLAFLLFPVTRGSSLLPLLGLTSESSVKYHIWLGHFALVFLTAHSIGYLIYWGSLGKVSNMFKWDMFMISNVAGEVAMLAGLAMWVTALSRIRRKRFELFFYTHQLYAVFFLFYLFHVGITYYSTILPGIYLFLVDRCLRFLQSRQRVRLLSARLLPGETMELNFSKSPELDYNPTSIIFINIPSLSQLQWHPFTVTSSSNLEPEKLSVVIKREGKWSQKLYQALSSPHLEDRVDISVEGPYGPPSNNFFRYDSLILVSGGSGITPIISILRDLIDISTNVINSPTPVVRLICAFKNSADLNMLDLILPSSLSSSDGISRLQLRIDAFITREEEPTEEAREHIRTVWFKPRASDSPISPVLGKSSWLCLAVVVAASFFAYLLLLAIVYRYHIYPADRNTYMVYPSSSRSLWNLLFVFVSVGAAAGLAVWWNKKGGKLTGNHGSNQVGTATDVPTPPTTSPGSWFYNAERELESAPSESLVKATTVRYGARPDLKKMLLECDEANTGVVVSGPKAMRRDVAAVCASGLAENLQYEGLSFTW